MKPASPSKYPATRMRATPYKQRLPAYRAAARKLFGACPHQAEGPQPRATPPAIHCMQHHIKPRGGTDTRSTCDRERAALHKWPAAPARVGIRSKQPRASTQEYPLGRGQPSR